MHHFVFIYGTFKRGESNHYLMTKKENGYSKFISNAETAEKYPLIIASRHQIPFLLDCPGKGENVLGEVYEVDYAMLRALDRMEHHPTIYVRSIEKVVLLENGDQRDQLNCWIYFLKKFKEKYLKRAFYKEYKRRGPGGSHIKREAPEPIYLNGTDVDIDGD